MAGSKNDIPAWIAAINGKTISQNSKVLVAANLTGNTARFAVTGMIRLWLLGAWVTTAIPAGANTLKFAHTPSGGAATDLCGTADTASAVLNTIFAVDGVKATALVKSTEAGILAAGQALHMPITIVAGSIATVFSAGPPATGAMTLFILWEPVIPGSTVT